MNQPRFFQKDTYHHLYNRGVNKLDIFFDINDYKFFQRRLLHYKRKYLIEILCYCLMSNHFHIFIRQTTKEYSISNFISDLINSYTKSINIKYKRSGVLFAGRTKSKIAHDERAFPVLVKYILLNPVRADLCENYEEYAFSSAGEFFGTNELKLTDTIMLRYFDDIKSFKEFMLLDERYDLIRNFMYD